MHQLVHIATRNWLKKNGLFSYWVQKVADQIQEVFPDDNYTNRALWPKYLPHALALMQEDEFIKQQKKYTILIQNIAGCLASDGRYLEAKALYKELLEIFQEENGPEHPSTLTSMANLASTFWNQGRWNEAEKLEVQVMETSKAVLGSEHPDTLTSMANLASTYRNQGRWNEAEKLEVQALETRRAVLGAEHPSTLTSIINLACTWKSQSRLTDALTLIDVCCKLRNKVLGPDHPDTRHSADVFDAWKHELDLLYKQFPRPSSQMEQSDHLQKVPPDKPEAIMARLSRQGHDNQPHTKRLLATRLFLRDHPLIIASRASSYNPGGRDSQDVD
jgi:tetratricopeptide (TPR) repeat protein